jgi:hypothetical protein
VTASGPEGPLDTLTTISAVRRASQQRADPARAALLRRFFKTGPGEYGAGDRFYGLTVPAVRAAAAKSFVGAHLETRSRRPAPTGAFVEPLGAAHRSPPSR